MSYYLLHLISPDIHIHKERGSLCYERGEERRQLPLEDIRGVVIATRNVKLSDNLISSLLENGAFILHCDNKYRPIGLTEPLSKITKRDVAYNQARCSKKLQTAIWQKLLGGKIYNQRNLLENIDADHSYLTESLKSKKLNESSCARHYWNEYFTHCGFPGLTRRSDDEHDANKMLNYAYAVLGAICHRSIVSHGMSPLFGVQHQARFHNHPFVYDLIEPLRSFVDYQLYTYLTSRNGEKPELKEWALFSQGCWDNIEVIRDKSHFKLIDAVDMYVNSLANCFQTKDVESVWLPELQVL